MIEIRDIDTCRGVGYSRVLWLATCIHCTRTARAVMLVPDERHREITCTLLQQSMLRHLGLLVAATRPLLLRHVATMYASRRRTSRARAPEATSKPRTPACTWPPRCAACVAFATNVVLGMLYMYRLVRYMYISFDVYDCGKCTLASTNTAALETSLGPRLCPCGPRSSC